MLQIWRRWRLGAQMSDITHAMVVRSMTGGPLSNLSAFAKFFLNIFELFLINILQRISLNLLHVSIMWKDKCKLSKVCARFLPSCRCTLWLFCSQGHAEFHRMWVNCDCEWVNYRLWLTLWDHFPHESPGWATSLPAWQRDSLRCYTCSHCLDRMAALIDPPLWCSKFKAFCLRSVALQETQTNDALSRYKCCAFFFHSCIVKPNRPQSDINWMRNTQAVSESTVAEVTLTPTWSNIGTLFRSGNYRTFSFTSACLREGLV